MDMENNEHVEEHDDECCHEHEHHHDHDHGDECHHDHDHEHHHHHHHDDDDECCDEHDHEHEHEDEIPEGRMNLGTTGYVDRSTHQTASIASAKGTLNVPADEADDVMCKVLGEIGDWVNENGGLVGHIKCTVSKEDVTAISYTDDTVQVKHPGDPIANVIFAAIVFNIEPEDMQAKVWNALEPYVV